MESICKKEDWGTVARVKRLCEYIYLIPGFKEELDVDPQKALDKLNLGLSVEDITFKPVDPENPLHMEAMYKGTAAEKYAEFMNGKLSLRDNIKERCTPTNEAMKKWRDRQMSRGVIELGAKSSAIVYVPFTIELSDGCSVGCEFCGLQAGRLKKVFRYTEENAKIFNGVIHTAKEIIGDAAGEGTMYFATEPLDNPDYELFLDDYVKCFGKIPQITTATALKHTKQLHSLLKKLNDNGRTIYRFSCLSQEIVEGIFKEFTPEELVLVELLPQFEEAPTSSLVKCGRNGDKADEYDDTISCVSGFVVNMARKSIRLTTPVRATKEHPTGEIIIEERYFEDEIDFESTLKDMIHKNMMNVIGRNSKLRIFPYIKWKRNGKSIKFYRNNESMVETSTTDKIDSLETLIKILDGKELTRREIVEEYISNISDVLIGSEYLYYMINKLWNMGILEDLSGQM